MLRIHVRWLMWWIGVMVIGRWRRHVLLMLLLIVGCWRRAWWRQAMWYAIRGRVTFMMMVHLMLR